MQGVIAPGYSFVEPDTTGHSYSHKCPYRLSVPSLLMDYRYIAASIIFGLPLLICELKLN